MYIRRPLLVRGHQAVGTTPSGGPPTSPRGDPKMSPGRCFSLVFVGFPLVPVGFRPFSVRSRWFHTCWHLGPPGPGSWTPPRLPYNFDAFLLLDLLKKCRFLYDRHHLIKIWKIYENQRKSKKIKGNLWNSEKIYAKSIKLYGNLWKSKKISENQRNQRKSQKS